MDSSVTLFVNTATAALEDDKVMELEETTFELEDKTVALEEDTTALEDDGATPIVSLKGVAGRFAVLHTFMIGWLAQANST